MLTDLSTPDRLIPQPRELVLRNRDSIIGVR